MALEGILYARRRCLRAGAPGWANFAASSPVCSRRPAGPRCAALSATSVPHQPGSPALAHVAECDDAGSCAGGGGTIVTFDSTGYKRIDVGAGFVDRNATTVSEVGSVPGVIE